ncbi:OadG family protein [bacterium]|nr:OadG family protein [bacterium]
MNIELFEQGILLMVIGMGFVFFFLAILIFAMNVTSKFIEIFNKYFPEVLEESNTKIKKKVDTNDEIALAIACAYARQGVIYNGK